MIKHTLVLWLQLFTFVESCLEESSLEVREKLKKKRSEQENEIGFLEIRMTKTKTKLCSI